MAAVHVVQGCIGLSHVSLIRQETTLAWYVLGTTCKYSEVKATSGASLFIGRGPHTLCVGHTPTWTEVSLPLPEGWSIVAADVSKYDIHVIATAPMEDIAPTLLWEESQGTF